MSLLSAACILMMIYGVYAIVSGRVYMKGNGLKPVYRDEQPKTFWFASVTDAVMGFTLYTIVDSNGF